MLVEVSAVLNGDELELIRKVLAKARFVDGKLSAGAVAQRVKNNQELDGSSAQIDYLNNLVMGNLVRHPVYRGAALALRVAAPYYARYGTGMEYGEHLDDPIMSANGEVYRSDIAITVFLNECAAYDGGELAIRSVYGTQEIKLAAGDAILYPASSLHRVKPVTRGERLVAVTWVQSLVREPARRELLYDLYRAREKLLQSSPDAAATTQVSTAYINLVRMWSEL